MKPVICIEMVFPEEPYKKRIEHLARAGFRHAEFWGWRDKNLPELEEACRLNGVSIVNFSGHRKGNLVDVETHTVLLEDYHDALSAAARLGTKTLMVLTNELGAGGLVVHPCDELGPERKRAAVIAGLKRMAAAAPSDMRLVIEPLNTVHDHGGYFLTSIPEAAAIIDEVGDARLGILCDFYHQGMMGDDLGEIIAAYAGRFGYVHAADVPGRHEPGTGRLDWKELLKQLRLSGYEGYVGFEYAPERDSGASLEVIARLWDSLGL